MSTGIEWTDDTWNPLRAYRPGHEAWTGGREEPNRRGWACVRVSAGCSRCYAATINKRLGTGLDYTVPAMSQVETYIDEAVLRKPLSWRKPRKVFVCSMTDLFGEWVTDGQIFAIWKVMRESPQHIYQVLTKRPERMREWLSRWADLSGESSEPRLVRGPQATREAHPSGRGQIFASYLDWLGSTTGGQPPAGAAWPTFDWMEGPRWWSSAPLPNVWLGTSVEDQAAADTRIPQLLMCPAAVRFLSVEPLLGPVDLDFCGCPRIHAGGHLSGLDWVIVGGESGPGARPCDVEWVRSIVRQCKAAGVPVFVKQLGAKPSDGNEGIKLRSRKGSDPSEWPEDLRVREWPE